MSGSVLSPECGTNTPAADARLYSRMAAHRFSEPLTGSVDRSLLLMVQPDKLKSKVVLIAVAHRGAHVYGVGRRERNLHHDQFFGCHVADDGHPDALSAEVGRAAP